MEPQALHSKENCPSAKSRLPSTFPFSILHWGNFYRLCDICPQHPEAGSCFSLWLLHCSSYLRVVISVLDRLQSSASGVLTLGKEHLYKAQNEVGKEDLGSCLKVGCTNLEGLEHCLF